MKVRDIISRVERDGWRLVKQKGSHRQYEHPVKPGKVAIAGRPSADVAPKTQYHGTSGVATVNYAAIFEKTDSGYSAYIPDLPGCIAAGSTFEETLSLLREAVELHLETMREDGDPIPEPTTIADYVAIPA